MKKLPKIQKCEVYKKGWGEERWIYNGPEYCGKILIFEKGKKCSWHYHLKKKEHFYLESGSMVVNIGWDDELNHSKCYNLKPGDCLEIPTGLRHQMYALEDSRLFEFSTEHFEDDSIRIIKGD